jgi:ABC-type transporter Mla maintaining outer membrane lipid asymmetry ATPase subunit MlaF
MTANRVIVLIDGKVASEGTFEELEKSKDKEIQSFFE